MEVRVDVYVEDIRTGMRYTMNRAYFTEVATDENGHPVPVPYGLLLETETQKAEWEGALRRKEMAKKIFLTSQLCPSGRKTDAIARRGSLSRAGSPAPDVLRDQCSRACLYSTSSFS
jgi:hypothetical protein